MRTPEENRKYVQEYYHSNEEYREKTKIRSRNKRLAKLGLNHEQYMEMYNAQDGVCALCGKPETVMHNGKAPSLLAVDHDHKTGKIRGLLCFSCNTGLGRIEQYLERAVVYCNQQ